jgi:hypothetical protein
LDATLAPLAAELSLQQAAAARATDDAQCAPPPADEAQPSASDVHESGADAHEVREPPSAEATDGRRGATGQRSARLSSSEDEDCLIAAKLAALSMRSPAQHRLLWRTSSVFRAGLLVTTLTGLLVHDLLGLHVLPPRGSTSWTALVAACVALPFARALPTTPRRRHAWATGHAAHGAFAPGSPPPRSAAERRATNCRGTAAEHAARAAASAGARAAFAAWERDTTVADAAADAAMRQSSTDVDEVARVLAARDHFDVLLLRRDADGAAARRAYRTTALRVHPDKCSSDGAAAAWERVQRAGQVLTDDDAREEYAAALVQAQMRGGTGGGGGLHAGGARRRTAPARWRGKWRGTAGGQLS